ncbi:MAG TPA: acetyl-CoA carboxylase biotin carboxylase subunit [Chloroflexota bacterium]|nr:acetyl-CoA carboxylase biotin carboxylase subunit [Chloroflexota bacterium]
MFERVLIANRGEIAVRIIRTLREMGITSIAVFSDADRDALFVQEADEAYYLGPAPASESYLNIEALIAAARQARPDAVHPGYGFLAENAGFGQAVADAGMTFIGPSPEAIRVMGDKVEARQRVRELGVPVVPGTDGPVRSVDEALAFASAAGYPVAVKAAGGGGGRGIRVVERPEDMAEALDRARREAEAYFKNPEVYLERYFPNPRHVEIQVLGDRHDHLVHLGERDCSVQRRHQKVIEETPSPAVDRELRARMGEMAVRAARSVDYSSAGTVEFLLTESGEFYFLEMNTRIQVEHPITERVTGVDLIREMILAAAGEHISVCSDILDLSGHAIEMRINAENPAAGFRPTPGPIDAYREPGGIGVRVDSGVYAGFVIPQDYDSLIAKLIVWAPDRARARLRALRALKEFRVDGPATTIPFHQAILTDPVFAEGKVSTTYVESHLSEIERRMAPVAEITAQPPEEPGPVREFDVEVNRKLFRVKVAERGASVQPARSRPRRASREPRASGNDVFSPIHGTVLAIKRNPGDEVQEGETLFIVEAMKMENEIAAPKSGTLGSIDVQLGDTVETGQTLATIS